MRPLALAVWLSLAAAPSGAAPKPAAPEVVTTAGLEGLVARLGAGRPLVLHFFTTWCVACRAELPGLRAHFRAYQKQGVAVVFVSADGPRTRGKVAAFLRAAGVKPERLLLLDAEDPVPVAAALGEPAWDGGLPATFVYDSKGAKVRALLGATDPGLLDATVEAAARYR
jgi:peroxiredoxin